MFDFINVEVKSILPKVWLDNPILRDSGFPLQVVENSGEVLIGKRVAKYQSLTFELLPSLKYEKYTMLLSGSIHSFRNEGKHNYDRFTFSDCIEIVGELFTVFGIDSRQANLHSLEFGVNLELPYKVQKLIQSVVVHKSKPYEAINKNRKIGVVCVRDGYEIKIYDKGFVCGLPKKLIRVEYHVSKMRVLQEYGISTLFDLTDKTKVGSLVDLLIDALSDTIFVPPDTDLSSLTQKQKINFHSMGKTYTWKSYTRKQRFDKRLTLARILKKCNAFDFQRDLKTRVLDEWKILLNDPKEASKTVTFTPDFSTIEAQENVTFTSLEYRVQTLQNDMPEYNEKEKLEERIFKQYCKTCGKEIINSYPSSIFCRKSTNPEAKKCRNKDSNKRRTFKAKIMRAIEQNKWLRITYKNPENLEPYTDTLHSSEIAVTREYLDSVISVEILHESPTLYNEPNVTHPEVLTGVKAIEMLEVLTTENMKELD